MNIAVVILNWNGKALLEQFLPAVIKYSKGATIYVADNASTDNSVAYVQSDFPEVKIVQNKENGGYAKGYNDALQHIQADIYCLLNSDIEVTPHWLDPVIELFKDDPNTSIVQPKILDFKRKAYFEYAGAAGGFIDKYGYPYCRGRIFNTLEKDTGQYDEITEIFWASGACLFIKSDVFHNLKGFDASFFAHMEEIDLCWRAKNQGHHIKYVPNAVVYHVGGATLNTLNPKKTYLNFRNSLFTVTKNAKGPLFFTIFTRLILDGIAGIKFLFELKPAHSIAVMKAHLNYYFSLKKLLKKRKMTSNKIKYYQRTSIVTDYFVNKKSNYRSL